MTRHPQIDLTVAYCSLQGAEAGYDREFGINVQWDIPLLDGYSWKEIPNRSLRPGLGRFFGIVNPGLWTLIRQGRFDALLLGAGYVYASFWIGLLAAKFSRVPVLFGTDATTPRVMDGSRWKSWLKPHVLPRIYALADLAYGTSRAGKEYVHSLGVPSSRIAILPLVADNDWWLARLAEVDRAAVRARWGVPRESPVVLYCAKLQPRKRPFDLLRAFANAAVPNSFLVIAGEGPLRAALESEVASFGLSGRVRFLGFINQTGLPAVYSAADLFVLPSEYDPCPVVVCEAMLCGTPVIISDEIRGRFELIREGETGFIFPCGDVEALAEIMRQAFSERGRLTAMRDAARRQMESWSPRTTAENLVAALNQLFAASGVPGDVTGASG
jgi:glycosyltransferase involved in cell wall biosynthesis